MPPAGIILTLFVQVALIIALSRAIGYLFGRMRQPQVMGEMVAGILLGPSLLGWTWPSGFQAIFPLESLQFLNVLSQVGVIFFLFLIGLELDPLLLRSRGRAAAGISVASIAVPFVLGVGLALVMREQLLNEQPHAHLLAASLFMGAAMSITAFPVLARILTERNLQRTPVGVMSIAAAAANDLAAWCILAFVVAIAQYAGTGQALRTALLAGLYGAGMFIIVKPLLSRLEVVHERQGRLSQNMMALILLLILSSAFVTERIGIHALFGAFLLGFVMPKGKRLVREISEKLEDFVVVFLLPLFFAYTGLRTQVNLLNSVEIWLYAGLIILVACSGKIGGTVAAARLVGISWRESTAIGVLMNTRGLVELILLTIGRDLNVIGDTLFTIMVIMALVTTAMTTPLLHWIYPARLLQPSGPHAAGAFSILLPLSLPSTVRPMAALAAALIGAGRELGTIYPLHLRRPAEHEAYRSAVDDSAEPVDPLLTPVLDYASAEQIHAEPLAYASSDVAADICDIAAARQVNMVLMGFHKPVFGKAMLGGTVHRVLSACPAHVGVFVDRGFKQAGRILVPYLGGTHDRLALELAARMGRNAGSVVTVLHVVPPMRVGAMRSLDAKGQTQRVFEDPSTAAPVSFRVVEHESPVAVVVQEAREHDLVIVGVAEEWGLESHLFGWRPERIARDCPTSLLIVRRYERAAEGSAG